MFTSFYFSSIFRLLFSLVKWDVSLYNRLNMPRRRQRTISLDEETFFYLSQAKDTLEKVTRIKMSWDSYLLATSTGALAISAVASAHFRCPACGNEMGLSVKGINLVNE
jgi:hypothetical protein